MLLITRRSTSQFVFQKVDYLKGQVVPDFVRDRRHMKVRKGSRNWYCRITADGKFRVLHSLLPGGVM